MSHVALAWIYLACVAFNLVWMAFAPDRSKVTPPVLVTYLVSFVAVLWLAISTVA
jgi:hypothetical protein